MRESLELFAHNLNFYMNRYGYNQVTLAKKLNKANSTVADWVHGRKFPRIEMLDKLTEVFHCKRSDLLEHYTTEETVRQSELSDRLTKYLHMLNADGMEKVLTYLEDLNPKFFREENQ